MFFRYDPYDKKFTEEFYDHTVMRDARKQEISKAKSASKFGLIVGTLGRQGNPKVMEHFQVSGIQINLHYDYLSLEIKSARLIKL